MAFASTWRQDETRGFRGLGALLVCGLLALLTLVVAVMFLWPARPTGHVSLIRFGSVNDYEVGEPVMVQSDAIPRIWIVRQDEDEIFAFIAKDTYLGCTVPWRPSFDFNGRRGWFRDPCHASTYDLDGTCVYGMCPRNLDRVPVIIRNEALFLDTSPAKIIRGGPTSKAIRPAPYNLP